MSSGLARTRCQESSQERGARTLSLAKAELAFQEGRHREVAHVAETRLDPMQKAGSSRSSLAPRDGALRLSGRPRKGLALRRAGAHLAAHRLEIRFGDHHGHRLVQGLRPLQPLEPFQLHCPIEYLSRFDLGGGRLEIASG